MSYNEFTELIAQFLWAVMIVFMICLFVSDYKKRIPIENTTISGKVLTIDMAKRSFDYIIIKKDGKTFGMSHDGFYEMLIKEESNGNAE